MLISALLGLLRHQDLTPAHVVEPKEAESYEDLAAGISASPPSASLRETGKEEPEATRLLHPVVCDDKPPVPADTNREYASFIKAVDRFVRKPRQHSLDIFE